MQDFVLEQQLNYDGELDKLSKTLFNDSDRRAWFSALKKLTGYHNFSKREGSLVKCCTNNDSIVVGKEFRQAAAEWYSKLAINGPTLEKS